MPLGRGGCQQFLTDAYSKSAEIKKPALLRALCFRFFAFFVLYIKVQYQYSPYKDQKSNLALFQSDQQNGVNTKNHRLN